MSNAQSLSLPAAGNNPTWAGSGNTYGLVTTDSGYGVDVNINYSGGYSASFTGEVSDNSLNIVTPQTYSGFAIDFGTASTIPTTLNNSYLHDNQPVVPWPKDQQIYYKLVGYNPSNQTFETWIIIEDIVTRPETFDPTGNVPNIDYGVYFTPPSGHSLVNIKIVGRWIQ